MILDNLSTGRKENVPERAELIVEDIRSQKAADLLAEKNIEILIHHAAQIDVRRSVEDPVEDAGINILGLINLLEGARKAGTKQVVFASTGGAIYGEQDFFPATEVHPVRPLSPYGVAKLASERYLFFYHAQYGIDVSCLRYANVYGPRQNPHGEAGVVAIFLDRLLAQRTPMINGDGSQTRDYVYVGDVVRANLGVLGRAGFNIYNVGTGIETDVNRLFETIHAALGKGPKAEYGPAKAGEQKRSSISSAFMEKELGIRPETSLEEGIKKTAEWFRSRTES